ncbi:MAG: cobalamin-binding protein [Deltaproteobacteria bacterium]|nr:cobalamin-binding protein [Deltaproteobacteria bacterium]
MSSERRNRLKPEDSRVFPFDQNDIRKRKSFAGIFLLVAVIILVNLGAGTALCASYKDALDRKVEIREPPGRIIPLAPSLTEILYRLGLGNRVVGVTAHCNYPPEAAAKPKVGSYINLNIEQIVSLAPELVIGTVDGNERRIVELIEKAGISVYLVNPRNVRDAIVTIALLGELCGVEAKAKALAAQLSARVDKVVEMTASRTKPLVFLQINLQPIMTVNSRTIHHDLISLAGGRNMTSREPITYPRISMEEIIHRQPDIILISSMDRGGGFEKAREEWLKWSSIPAVKAGRVHLIESDLIDRPSPRVVEGLEKMARLIHPGINWK